MTIEPFRICVSDNVLNDLRTRLARTRFTDPFRGSRRRAERRQCALAPREGGDIASPVSAAGERRGRATGLDDRKFQPVPLVRGMRREVSSRGFGCVSLVVG